MTLKHIVTLIWTTILIVIDVYLFTTPYFIIILIQNYCLSMKDFERLAMRKLCRKCTTHYISFQ